jgi:hypothetical protein
MTNRFAAVVAILIALGQLAWASVGSLTPWKGGGFGMFATIDNPRNRLLIVTGTDHTDTDRRVLLDARPLLAVPQFRDEYIQRLLAAPTVGALTELGRAVMKLPLRVIEARQPSSPPVARRSPIWRAALEDFLASPNAVLQLASSSQLDARVELRRVSVSVRGLRFGSTKNQLVIRTIAETTVFAK